MAQTGYTPILIYSSSTVSQAPSAGNLTNSTLGSELAINITDGKLFYKDNANAVQVIAWKTTPTTAGGTGLTSYTAGDLLYYVTGTTLSKLAIGASKTILTSSGTAPQWSTSLDTTQGGTGLTTYTAGDLPYYATGTALSKLGIGAANTVLTSSGTAPQWTVQSSLSVGTAANLLSNATTGVMQIVGPGAGTTRVMTIPNANFTAARTDAAQTFTGVQTFSNQVNVAGAIASGAANTTVIANATGQAQIWALGPNTSTAGTLLFVNARSDLTNSTQLLGFDTSGNGTLYAGNLVIGTSGKGIDFSATPGTGTSELFDDYEEGTWTPTITNVTGTYTSTTVNYAQYTKIGEVVYGFLSVQVVTLGTASANMNFTLPFTPAREGYGSGRENVNTGDMLIPRIITGGSGEGRLYKTDGSAAGAAAGTYVVSFMYLT